MTGWVFPVRLFHSRLFAGFQRRTKGSVNPSASRRLRAYADAPDSVDPSLIHRAPWPRPRLPSLEGWTRTTNYRPTAVPVTTPGVGPPTRLSDFLGPSFVDSGCFRAVPDEPLSPRSPR